MKFHFSDVKPAVQKETAGQGRVLRAAKATFIASGGSKFSARAVAKEAGITLRAVQHFYPTTDQLLAAVLEFVVNQFESAYEALFRTLPFNGEARLLGVVDILLDSNWEQETRQVFYGLYALSCYNEFAATLMRQMFERHIQNLASLIGGARPRLSEKQCYELAVHLAATIDGAMVVTARSSHPIVNKISLSRIVRSNLVTLLDSDEERSVAKPAKVRPRPTGAAVARRTAR